MNAAAGRISFRTAFGYDTPMYAWLAARHWTLFRVALFPLLVAAIVWRMPVSFSRLWAEEGTVYFSRAWNLPAAEALLALHSGYLNIVANVATFLASRLVAPENAPQVTAGIALLVQLLPALLLVTASEPWLRRPAPLLAAVAFTLVPVRAGEVWLNSINSHFYLMACTGLILALAPRGGATGFLRLAVLLLAPLSGPGNAFLWPFFVLRAWRERTATRWAQVAILSLGIAIQAALVLASPIEERPFGTPLGVILSFISLQHVLLPLLGGQITWPIAASLYHAFDAGQQPLWALLLPLPFLAGFAWAAWRADTTVRWLFAAGLWLAVVSYFSALALPTRHVLLLGLGCRYALAPTLLFAICLVGLAATAQGALLRQAATGLVWWTLAVGTVGFHDIPTFFTTGPDWRHEVTTWRANPAHVIQIWPPGWTVHLQPRMK